MANIRQLFTITGYHNGEISLIITPAGHIRIHALQKYNNGKWRSGGSATMQVTAVVMERGSIGRQVTRAHVTY